MNLRILKKFINIDDINNINYNEICNFRRLEDIDSIIEITEKIDRTHDHRELENAFVSIQKKLFVDSKKIFTETVMLNVNIFCNGVYDDYNRIFKSINLHSNELSKNELLASMLFSCIIELNMENQINQNIKREIKNFYTERDKNSSL